MTTNIFNTVNGLQSVNSYSRISFFTLKFPFHTKNPHLLRETPIMLQLLHVEILRALKNELKKHEKNACLVGTLFCIN